MASGVWTFLGGAAVGTIAGYAVCEVMHASRARTAREAGWYVLKYEGGNTMHLEDFEGPMLDQSTAEAAARKARAGGWVAPEAKAEVKYLYRAPG